MGLSSNGEYSQMAILLKQESMMFLGIIFSYNPQINLKTFGHR